MKLRYIALTIFLLGVSANVLADDIFCPPQLVCSNQVCKGNPTPPPVFNDVMLAASPILDGTYYFSSAYSNTNNIVQCQYRDLEGHTWAFLKTSQRLLADTKPRDSFWWGQFRDGKNGQYLCTPNKTKPYLGNPERCPFSR